MPRFQTVEQVLAAVQAHFRPEKAGDAAVVGHLHIAGEGGGDWTLRIAEGRLTITHGAPENPDAMRLEASREVFLALANGELDATKAYFSGKVRFKGSLRQAYSLMDLFRLSQEDRDG